MRPLLLEKLARQVDAGDVRDAGFVPMDRLHLAVEKDPAASLDDLVRGRFPHLPGPEPGIEKIADEGLGRGRRLFALEGVDDRLAQGKALDALRGPVGADFVAGDAPDFFGVGFEKNLEKALAETIGDPLGKGLLGLDRDQAGFDIAEEDVEGFIEPD